MDRLNQHALTIEFHIDVAKLDQTFWQYQLEMELVFIRWKTELEIEFAFLINDAIFYLLNCIVQFIIKIGDRLVCSISRQLNPNEDLDRRRTEYI